MAINDIEFVISIPEQSTHTKGIVYVCVLARLPKIETAK